MIGQGTVQEQYFRKVSPDSARHYTHHGCERLSEPRETQRLPSPTNMWYNKEFSCLDSNMGRGMLQIIEDGIVGQQLGYGFSVSC